MIIIRERRYYEEAPHNSAIYHRKTPNVEAVISIAARDSATANEE